MMRTSALALLTIMTLAACNAPDPGTMDRDEELQISAYKGKAYMERKNPQMALPSLRRVQELEPDNVENLVLLASAYYLLDRPLQSLATFERALALRSESGDIHNRLGLVLLRLKRVEEAERHFALALNDPRYLNPEEAYLNLALMEKDRQNSESMVTLLKKALRIKPNHVSSHLELARHYHLAGEFVLEQEHLNAILAVESDLVPVMNKLAQSYQKSGDLQRSQTIQARIKELSAKSDGADHSPRNLQKDGQGVP